MGEGAFFENSALMCAPPSLRIVFFSCTSVTMKVSMASCFANDCVSRIPFGGKAWAKAGPVVASSVSEKAAVPMRESRGVISSPAETC